MYFHCEHASLKLCEVNKPLRRTQTFHKNSINFHRICHEVRKQRYHSPTTVTLLVVVTIFIICQSARCAANLADAALFLKLSEQCRHNEDYVSLDGWSILLHTLSRILLVINRYNMYFCKKILFLPL